MSKSFSRFLYFWLPLLLWAGTIFLLSAHPGVGFSWSNPKTIFLRKGFHILEYSLLSFLIWRLSFWGYKISLKKSFWIAVIFSGLFALSDEWHQLSVFGRSGSISDFLLDLVAGWLTIKFFSLFFQKIKIKDIIIFSALLLSLVTLFGIFIFNAQEIYRLQKERVGYQKKIKKINQQIKKRAEEQKTKDDLKPIPVKKKIEVAFTSQAPFAVWDETHEEACEEASLLMVNHWLKKDKRKLIPAKEAESEIQQLKTFEITHYGDFRDSNMKQLIHLAREFYGLTNLKVVYDFSLETLKKELAKGRPIIAPTAGRELKNPYFTPPGPLYHNLVLIGYNQNEIIVNDPGTRRGKNYHYKAKILFDAIHDFPDKKEHIKQGRKAMIIIKE